MSNRPRRARVVPPEEEPGLTFEDLFADLLTFTMTVKGKDLTVSWAPASFTPDVQAAVSALMGDDEEEDEELVDDESLDPAERLHRDAERARATSRRRDVQNAAVRQFLLRVIRTWDLKHRDGRPVPLDEATLMTLPPAFLELVMERMMENAGPKDQTEPPSADS